ncbi:MAG: MAPEG family protein [Bdellovibrionia bacterium]
MTTDLMYLAFTAALTATLWIPYIACQIMSNGIPKPVNYVDPTPRPVPLWGKRADRTYMNAVESFAPFAVMVLLVHITGKANSTTAFCAMFFFWMRVVHATVYLLGIPYIRTVSFTAGYFAVMTLFWQLMMGTGAAA